MCQNKKRCTHKWQAHTKETHSPNTKRSGNGWKSSFFIGFMECGPLCVCVFVCLDVSIWGKWVFAISETTCAASRWQSDAVSSVTRPSPPPLPWLCMCPSQLSSQVLLLLLLRTQALCENHLCVRVRVCDRVWLLGYNNQVGPCRRAQASNIYTDFSLTDVHSACPLTLLSLVCVLLKKPIL